MAAADGNVERPVRQAFVDEVVFLDDGGVAPESPNGDFCASRISGLSKAGMVFLFPDNLNSLRLLARIITNPGDIANNPCPDLSKFLRVGRACRERNPCRKVNSMILAVSLNVPSRISAANFSSNNWTFFGLCSFHRKAFLPCVRCDVLHGQCRNRPRRGFSCRSSRQFRGTSASPCDNCASRR